MQTPIGAPGDVPPDPAVDRQAKYETQTAQLYAGLGEFVAQFEQLIFAMRYILPMAFGGGRETNGLIAPAYAELTADPLRRVFGSTMAIAIDQSALSAEEKAVGHTVLRSITKRIQTLTEKRNEIVHGTWFIGWASAEQSDFSTASGFKPKNTKEGVAHTNISRTREGFDDLIMDCLEASCLVKRMMVLFHGSSFSKNFIFVGGEVSLDDAHWTFSRRRTRSAPEVPE
jgi:hypothetical protein